MKEIIIGNGLYPIIAQALEEMKSEQGSSFRLEEVNLSELQRRKMDFKKSRKERRNVNQFWMGTLLLLTTFAPGNQEFCSLFRTVEKRRFSGWHNHCKRLHLFP